MTTKSVLSQSAQMQSGSAMALGALMNKSAAKGRSKPTSDLGSPAASAPASAPASPPAARGQDMTKSVLSQSQGMTSSAGQALGALAAKNTAGKSSRPAANTTSAVAGAPAARSAGPDMTKSVLSQSQGMSSSSAQALGALALKSSSARGADAQRAAPAAPAAAAPPAASAPAAAARPDMTKSVLSQAQGMTSSSAQALGALAATRAPSNARPVRRDSQGPADQSSALGGEQSTVLGAAAGAPIAAVAAAPPMTTQNKGPNMAASVLSQSHGFSSSSAQALGALAGSRRPAGAAASVLSQSAAPTSGAAMALGGLAGKRAAEPGGYPRGEPASPPTGTMRSPEATAFASPTGQAGDPPMANQGMSSPSSMKMPSAVDLVSQPLLHPMDAISDPYSAGGSRLPMTPSFPWCATDGSMDSNDLICRPKQMRPKLIHPDSKTMTEQVLPKHCYAAQVHCGACTHDIVYEIFNEA